MIGLGRMGGNMTQRLLKGGHRVVAYDPDAGARRAAQNAGADGAGSIAEVAGMLTAPRAVWVMVPAGDVTDATINELTEALEAGDAIIDGGNSNYKQTVRQIGRAHV